MAYRHYLIYTEIKDSVKNMAQTGKPTLIDPHSRQLISRTSVIEQLLHTPDPSQSQPIPHCFH